MSALRAAGFLLAVSDYYLSGSAYVITGVGAFTAEAIREERSPGFAGQEADARRLLESSDFRQAYSSAFARWAEAGQALRSSSDTELTTVGHKAREAMQTFATELLQRYDVADEDANPALIKKRLGAVIAKFLPELGEARAGLLKALGDYAEAAMDLIQRQEHGGQKESSPLTWSDGRRVVFHVGSVVHEFATTIREVAAGE